MTWVMGVNEILEQGKQSIDYSYRNKTLTSIDYRSIDRVLDSFPQLVPEAYRGWHANAIRRVGADKYIELANRAIKYGRDPQKLMARLVKEQS